MSTPSTLVQTVPHQHQLDHHRYLPSPQDRFLPPPRPSSNLSNGYHHNPLPSIPARPSSNLSRQLPPPPPESSGMSTAGYSHNHNQQQLRHSHSQSHAGSEYPYPHVNGVAHDDLRRTDSRSSQHQHSRHLPPPHILQHQQQQQQQHLQASSPSRAMPAVTADAMPPAQYSEYERRGSSERGRKRRQKSPVDWVAFFGGKPPSEIIEIHDDDSPAPQATIQRLPPPITNGASHSSQHVEKKRRVNGSGGDAPGYSTTNTPYSYTNGTSTDSLHPTTAPTSLGSQASTSGRVDNTQTTGQKRKRTTRTTDAALRKQEAELAGPQGYLAEYGEYHPPAKLSKKQKDVVVPAIHDVWISMSLMAWQNRTNFICSAINRRIRLTTRMGITLCTKTAASARSTTF